MGNVSLGPGGSWVIPCEVGLHTPACRLLSLVVWWDTNWGLLWQQTTTHHTPSLVNTQTTKSMPPHPTLEQPNFYSTHPPHPTLVNSRTTKFHSTVWHNMHCVAIPNTHISLSIKNLNPRYNMITHDCGDEAKSIEIQLIDPPPRSQHSNNQISTPHTSLATLKQPNFYSTHITRNCMTWYALCDYTEHVRMTLY